MTVALPRSLDEALAALAAEPDAHVLAGGTDFMVEVNFGHRRPPAVVALQHVPELRGWRRDGGTVTLGAGVTYAELQTSELADLFPALAHASRGVGSPQIRNAGTIGGNLGTASPAGDTLPVLAALDAEILVASTEGTREVAFSDFVLGPKRNALQPGELITGVRVPVLRGGQEYVKVGTRNAMVIAVAAVALVVDLDGRSVRCGLGSVGPTALRAPDAEAWVAAHVDWDTARIPDPRTYETFGSMVAEASRPIDDHRSTAGYRRHAVGVCARRTLMRVLP